jgi:hypothetical protein
MNASDVEDRKHRAVRVKVGPQKAEIDKGLAPLITAIWEANIHTVMSCQETWPGIAWIQFLPGELAAFLNLVTSVAGQDELYDRIHGVGSDSVPGWKYTGTVFDCNYDKDEPPEFGLVLINAHFPTSDIPLLVERLAVVAASLGKASKRRPVKRAASRRRRSGCP